MSGMQNVLQPGQMQTGDVVVPAGRLNPFMSLEMRICGKYSKHEVHLPPGALDCVPGCGMTPQVTLRFNLAHRACVKSHFLLNIKLSISSFAVTYGFTCSHYMYALVALSFSFKETHSDTYNLTILQSRSSSDVTRYRSSHYHTRLFFPSQHQFQHDVVILHQHVMRLRALIDQSQDTFLINISVTVLHMEHAVDALLISCPACAILFWEHTLQRSETCTQLKGICGVWALSLRRNSIKCMDRSLTLLKHCMASREPA